MNSNCYQCTKPVQTLEFMQCNFCGHAVHLKCVGLKRPNMDFVNEQKNILWCCDECFERLETIKDYRITSSEIVTEVSQSIKESLKELRNDLLETKSLAKSLATKIESNDCASNQARPTWPSIKRPRDTSARDTPRETPRSRPNAKLVVGTKSVEKENMLVETVAKPAERFWIYLSRISRHATEADIVELVKGCLNTQSIDVKKLVRKDADLKQFAFISFKVGVDKKLKDIALDPASWPKGIYFREFENLQSERDFWGPAKIPRIDDGTPQVGTPMIVPSPATVVTPSQ